MKSLPLICLIFCCCFNLKAQETTPSNKEYLFDSFTDGKALLKNKRFNQTKFNYNCVYQELHFLNNGEDMTMDNNSNIDTIYIDNRKFIPHLNRFLNIFRSIIPSCWSTIKPKQFLSRKKEHSVLRHKARSRPSMPTRPGNRRWAAPTITSINIIRKTPIIFYKIKRGRNSQMQNHS